MVWEGCKISTQFPRKYVGPRKGGEKEDGQNFTDEFHNPDSSQVSLKPGHVAPARDEKWIQNFDRKPKEECCK